MGERIEGLRKREKMTQDELAITLGKSHRSVISSWEKGKAEPVLGDLRKLAEVLKTTVPYLTDGITSTLVEELPSGYRLVREEELHEKDQQLIQAQKELLNYQRLELERTRA